MGAGTGAAVVLGVGAIAAVVAYAAGVRVSLPSSSPEQEAAARAQQLRVELHQRRALEAGSGENGPGPMGGAGASRWNAGADFAGGIAAPEPRRATAYSQGRFAAAQDVDGIPSAYGGGAGGATSEDHYTPSGTLQQGRPGWTPNVGAVRPPMRAPATPGRQAYTAASMRLFT